MLLLRQKLPGKWPGLPGIRRKQSDTDVEELDHVPFASLWSRVRRTAFSEPLSLTLWAG